MMKYIGVVLYLFFTSFSMAGDVSNKYVEDEFWVLISDFDQNLVHKKEAAKTIERLKFLANSSDSNLIKDEMFLRNVQFLKIYASSTDLENFFEQNFKKFSKKHSDYFSLYADYVLLLDLLGKHNNANVLVNALASNDGSQPARIYSLALNLFLEPSKNNYEQLTTLCSEKCNFSLYYISVMNYFKSKGLYISLEKYSKGLLGRLIEKKLIVSNHYFPQYVMAYLSSALNRLNKKDLAEYFQLQSIQGLSPESYIYDDLVKAVN